MHFNLPSNFICFAIQERSVDFPLPFAPTAAKISPSFTSTDRFERTSFPFSYPAYKCEIERIAFPSECVILDDGKVIEQGNPKEVARHLQKIHHPLEQSLPQILRLEEKFQIEPTFSMEEAREQIRKKEN